MQDEIPKSVKRYKLLLIDSSSCIIVASFDYRFEILSGNFWMVTLEEHRYEGVDQCFTNPYCKNRDII